jgi:hypothetical protein
VLAALRASASMPLLTAVMISDSVPLLTAAPLQILVLMSRQSVD